MKRRQIKKLVALVITCAMLSASLIGCGSKEDSSSTGNDVETSAVTDEAKKEDVSDGTFDPRSVTEGVTLTVAVADNARVEDFNTNKMTLMIEEALGVDLQFETYASQDYQTKLNAMVYSGEKLPDIIFNASDENISAWAKEGAVVELSEWFENKDYAANLYETQESAGVDIMSYMKNADGEMYGFPYYMQSTASEIWAKMWVYEPWLEKLGKELPTTTEEYFELCKLACATDLNGNGKADEIALTGTKLGDAHDAWFEYLMTPFVYAFDERYLVVEDGELSFAYMSEEWKEGLKYIKRFFDEGLIPLETLTQSQEQYEALWYADETVLMSFIYWHMQKGATEYVLEWTHVPCLEGPEGVYQAMYKPSVPDTGKTTCITTDCENPLAAFLVCDFMCSEVMSISNRYGEQGVNWDYLSDLDVNLDDYTYQYDHYQEKYLIKYDDAGFFGGSEPQNVSYLQSGPYVLSGRAIFANVVPKEPKTEAEQAAIDLAKMKGAAYADCLANAREEVIDYMPMTADEIQESTDTVTLISNYLYEITGQFLTGAKDIDAEWDNFQKQMKEFGVDQLLETYQVAYDRVH